MKVFNKIKKAFTLVELVVVIAVIAILAGVSVGAYFGVTESAKVSADTQIVAQLNTAVSVYKVNKEINNEEDLKNIINSTFLADNSFEEFVPQSVNQGYHYWFKTDSQTFVLEKTNNLITKTRNKVGRSSLFENKNIRSNLIDGYYLVDQKGSLLVDTINSLSNIASGDEYKGVITDIKDLKQDKNDGSLGNKVENVFASTAYITNTGAYRYSNVEEVTNISFAKDLTNVNTNIYLYDKDTESLTYNYQNKNDYQPVANVNEIHLPDTVASIGSFAFHFVDEDTKIYIDKTLEEVKQLFKAEGSNATIVYKNENNENEEIKLSSLTLPYSDKVNEGDYRVVSNLSFEKLQLIKDTTNDKIDIFVAYDVKTFNLDVEFNDNLKVSTTDVVWELVDTPSYNGENLFSLNNGEVTINYLPTENYTGNIKVIPVAGGYETNISITVVRITSGVFNIGNHTLFVNNIQLEDEITLSYEADAPTSFEIGEFVASTNLSNSSIVLDNNIKLTSTGNIFNLDNRSLNLTGEEFGTQILKVEVGEYLSKEFKITVVDNSSSPFETVYSSDTFIYKIGNNDAISFTSLFKLAEGKNVDDKVVSIDVYDASLTGSNNTYQHISTNTNNSFNASINQYNGTNWNEQTIKFNGEGVVIIEISTNSNKTRFVCEILNGYNVTNEAEFDAALSKNMPIILLGDFKVSYNNNDNYIRNTALYGNGFTIDATAVYNTAEKNSHGFIRLENGVIDNAKIIGGVYSQISFATDMYGISNDMYVETVRSDLGRNVIRNSYISGMRSAVAIMAPETIITDSVIEGGTLSNIHIIGGNNYFKNVITIQTSKKATFSDTSKTIKGLGIVLESAANNTTLTLEGTLNQYNWFKSNDMSNVPSEYSLLFSEPFQKDYSQFHFTHNSKTVINTGISYMGTVITPIDNRSDKEAKPYKMQVKTYDNTTFAFYSILSNNGTLTDNDLLIPEFNNENQDLSEPKFVQSDFGNQEDKTLTEYSYSLGKVIYIGISSGSSYELKTNTFINISKYGTPISYSLNNLSVDNSDSVQINGYNITFKNEGVYYIEVKYTDLYFFDLNGNSMNKTVDYSKVIEVNVRFTEDPLPTINVDTSKTYSYFMTYIKSETCGVKEYEYYMGVNILDGLSITYKNKPVAIDKTKMPDGLTVAIVTNHWGIAKDKTWSSFSLYNNSLLFRSNGGTAKPIDKSDNTNLVHDLKIQYIYSVNGSKVPFILTVRLDKNSKTISESSYSNVDNTSNWVHTYDSAQG